MSISLGLRLKIRSIIHVAAEPIPFFWPMRTFIHHNPLHGLEHLPFEDALKLGAKLFHGRTFLPRVIYQKYLHEGKVARETLSSGIKRFLDTREGIGEIPLEHWMTTLMSERERPVSVRRTFASAEHVYAALHAQTVSDEIDQVAGLLQQQLRDELLGNRPIYEAVDALYGTAIGTELDELVIKICLDFFDEGQSVWGMPDREHGLYYAWRDNAMRNVPFFLRGLNISNILSKDDRPEGVIAYVLTELGVPEEHWIDYLTREMTRLHGWTGFIRWRSNAKNYYWEKRFPGDLVDFVAIRLTLALALLIESGKRQQTWTTALIEEAIEARTAEMYLRHELNGGRVAPSLAHSVDLALMRNKPDLVDKLFAEYVSGKLVGEAQQQAKNLLELATLAGDEAALMALSKAQLQVLMDLVADLEAHEGMIWLRSMEVHAVQAFLNDADRQAIDQRDKRPFAQALFCIDTRSERIRRHLESVGDYQTFGIAGFFGVPVSFMELGKGSEVQLCPVILTPKNLVPEISSVTQYDEAAIGVLEKAVHELKESVLAPFVTVEAIGLLFGFDMVGKTIAPRRYNLWRRRLHPAKPHSRLLVDKLSREQADSIVRAVQRAVIVNAVEQELGLAKERITDDLVRELREAALGDARCAPACCVELGLDPTVAQQFVDRLAAVYQISETDSYLQMQRLGRIGFTLDEQVNYVGTALRSIGMTDQFSRFVLLVGHGSTSDNNPYESALDCGACGGNHGLVSAKVLAQMANKPEVRRVLRRQGIDIPDDSWFLPVMHNTTTDELDLQNLELLPPAHLVYIDRVRNGLTSATRLCAAERVPTLETEHASANDPTVATRLAQRNAMDWSQVRPEWGLSRNAYFVIGRRALTRGAALDGRAFLHSYDYRVDPKRRLLETILTGPLVVGQWINMEHYFSTVDNDCFGSGSKVNQNVAGRFGVMTGNLSDLRTGLPSQTVLKDGLPYHEPLRLITVIEAPFAMAFKAIDGVVAIKRLVKNAWIRMLIVDPETQQVWLYSHGEWIEQAMSTTTEERSAS